MNKTLYYFGAALLALAMAGGLTNSVLLILVGGSLYTLEAFSNWFWVSCAIALSGSLVLLKYFAYKAYHFAFWTGVFTLFANVLMNLFLWQILAGRSELLQVYIVASFGVLVTSIVYSISLIFSAASGKVWLNRAGIFFLPYTGAMLVLVSLSVFSSDALFQVAIQKVIVWASLPASVFPLLLMLNFIAEAKTDDSNIRVPDYITAVLGVFFMVGFSLALVFGGALVTDGKTHLYWQTKNAEATAEFVAMGEERSFQNSKGETLKYVLVKPADYDPGTKYPLVVSLPYGGYEASAAQLLASGTNRYKYPAFLFVPFCPEGAGWGGIPNYPTIDTLVFDAIVALEKEVSIDVNRRYVTGVSRGGYGSWHFITSRPDMFAAAIPVCGGGNPQLASRLVNVHVWAFHGAHDRNVPVAGSRDMIDAIRKAGGDPKYTEFPDKAHNIWYEVTQTPGLWDWLFEQKILVKE